MLTTEQDRRLMDCIGVLDTDRLSEWENEFIGDLAERSEAQVNLTLSVKQDDILARIHREKILGERSDPHHRDVQKKPIKALAGMAGVPFIIVYRSPGDYPKKYVARRFEAKPNGTVPTFTQPVSVRDTYELVRDAVRANLPGATRIPLNGAPDAVVMELWA